MDGGGRSNLQPPFVRDYPPARDNLPPPLTARNASLLAYRLRDARQPLPAEVCTLAERALEAFGSKAASVQNEVAGVSGELAALMVRLHEQTNDPVLRERVLNTIDEMIRAGVYGIGEQLNQQYDR